MATLNISLPDALKQRFFDTFPDQNKSALVAELIAGAIDEVERQRRGEAAADRILARRTAAGRRPSGTTLKALRAVRNGAAR